MKKKDESYVRRPSIFIYWFGAYVMRLFSRVYWRLKIDNKEIRKLKSPVLAIASHTSTLDIVPTAATLLPKRYNVVMGKDLFTWKQLRPFINAFGAIPIDQGAIDLACVRKMKAAIERKRNILLYPEGRTSLDGRQLYYLSPSIGKFIKLLGCTVVTVHQNGTYLSKPRYIDGFRRGRIETKASVLLTKEEVLSLSPKEITARVRKALEFNDHLWQQQNHVRFTAKDMASHLDYVLYKCPKCGAEYEMKAENGVLTCTACGNTVRYTEYGELLASEGSKTFPRLDLWVDFERHDIDEAIENEDFSLTKNVTCYIRDDELNKYVEQHKGTLTIDRSAITYRSNEGKTLTYSLTEVVTIVTKNSEGIDLLIDGVPYRFLFDERKWSFKYGLIVERLFAQKHNLP